MGWGCAGRLPKLWTSPTRTRGCPAPAAAAVAVTATAATAPTPAATSRAAATAAPPPPLPLTCLAPRGSPPSSWSLRPPPSQPPPMSLTHLPSAGPAVPPPPPAQLGRRAAAGPYACHFSPRVYASLVTAVAAGGAPIAARWAPALVAIARPPVLPPPPTADARCRGGGT